MKKTARRILSAILMSSLLFTSGISAIAATDAPAAVESQNLPLEGKVSAKLTDEVSSAEASYATPAETTTAAPAESPIVLGETRATINEAPDEVVTIEENVTPLAPKAESTLSPENETPLSPELPLEGKLSQKATDEVLSDEVSSNEESSNDLSPALTLTSTTYSGVTVEVNADEGVLPSDAYLFVAEIKSRAGKQTAEDALGNTNIEYDDYMVLDIQIRNGQAEEIEPDGNVRVNIMMDAAKLPEDADESTLEIQHLAENANGEIKAVETVADNGNMTDGSVGINGDNIEAEFKVGSFSFFTLTWQRREHPGSVIKLYFDAYTVDGQSLGSYGTGDIDMFKDLGYTDTATDFPSGGKAFMLVDLLEKQNLKTIDVTVDGQPKTLHFHYATAVNGEGKTFFVDRLNYRHDLGKVELKNGETEITTFSYIIDETVDEKDRPINLYYKTDGLTPVASVESIEVEKDNGTVSSVPVSDVIDMYMYKFTGNPSNEVAETYYKGKADGTVRLAGEVQSYGGTKHYRGQITRNLASALISQGKDVPEINMGTHTATSTPNNWMPADERWFDKNGQGDRQGAEWIAEFGKSYGKAAEPVKGLFVEEIYKDYGYFYYGSDEYGAELDDNGTFHLYEEVMSPAHYNADKAYFWRRGNFLPYNKIKVDEVVALTEHDMSGNELQPGDKLYHKPVYAVESPDGKNYKIAGDNTRGIFSFGMSVQATFFQPTGGMRKNPATGEMNPMVFRFNGDDDFWLYIDGVRILDLGGAHDAQEGFIDFSTGKVYWTDNGSVTENGKVKSDQSVENRPFINYKGESDIMYYDGETTIKQLFIDAYGGDADAEEAVEALRCWNENTFKDGTVHTMQIFYMEHGGGASNLRMMFNIPVQPVSDLTVSKAFVENGKPKEVPDDFVATFEVYEMKRENGTSGKFVAAELVNTIELNKETAYDGTFTKDIGDGKSVFKYNFKNLPVSHEYVVVERIYRSDNGYLNTIMNKAGGSFRYDESMSDEDKKALESLIPNVKKTITVTDATGTKIEEVDPTYTHVSNIVEMLATGAEPSVLRVENHYQMTLTVEKHVHSQNTEDIDRDYQFRLYLRKKDAQGNYVYYTEPLYEAPQIGSKNPEDWGWDQLGDPFTTVVEGQNYYAFTLKDIKSTEGKGRVTLGVPAGYEYVVEEYLGGEFRVFRPFINMYKVARDENGNVIPNNGDVQWKDEVYKPRPIIGGVSGDKEYQSTPDTLAPNNYNLLDDDARVVFINERQIVRTGVVLNSAPTMMMLAVVFFAAAGICVKYLRKKADEEAEEHGDLFD